MAHFAKLNSENEVEQVISVHNNELLENSIESEEKGIQFCKSLFGQDTVWKKVSYNTKAGKHYTDGRLSEDQSKAFRKNFPGIGWIYNPILDAFMDKKPYESWVLDENTAIWKAPIEMPKTSTTLSETGTFLPDNYYWDEPSKSWIKG
jgi:hypothetical protein